MKPIKIGLLGSAYKAEPLCVDRYGARIAINHLRPAAGGAAGRIFGLTG
jgi:hypothetical protein